MTLIGFHSLLLFLGVAAPAFACMNEYRPANLNVKAIERSESVSRQIFENHGAEDWSDRAAHLRSELDRGGDFRVKNDLAVALAHAGDAAQAVTLLEEIEREKPGLYVTAANLGTAYELVGDNVRALEWIRQGIKRNEDSHQGSEWLHVRILEAKLALEKDPHWLAEHSILGFSTDAFPKSMDIRGNRGEKLKPAGIKDALIYQLHERVQFVKPPDAVVGSLLYDLGRLIAQESSGLGGAKDVFIEAKSYMTGLGMDSIRDALDSLITRAAHAQEEGYVPGQLKVLTYVAICLWGFIIAYAMKRLLARFTKRPCIDPEL
jgi:tetratricopeptide (TPR) repeat protein